PDQGGLAVSVAADDADPVPLVDAERDTVEQGTGSVDLADGFQIDEVGGHCAPCCRPARLLIGARSWGNHQDPTEPPGGRKPGSGEGGPRRRGVREAYGPAGARGRQGRRDLLRRLVVLDQEGGGRAGTGDQGGQGARVRTGGEGGAQVGPQGQRCRLEVVGQGAG